MRSIVVELGARSYEIFIGRGLLQDPSKISSICRGQKILIVTNQTIAPLYLESLTKTLTPFQVEPLILPDGESYKNFEHYQKVLETLVSHQFRRVDMILALGGGVIGDLAGFAAATYQRGVDFIQIPTSLLAQVDSSVGGKTGINHSAGKNLIGAFYQPKRVLIDLNTLATLPDREYLSGLAEIVKYGFLGELEILNLLRQHAKAIVEKNTNFLEQLIYLSCLKKSQVVAEDETESGARALLNLGHSFGHAIEKVTQYQQYLHGEAVAIGMVMAFNLAYLKSMISKERLADSIALIRSLGLPTELSSKLSGQQILKAMQLDKKNTSKKYRLILPSGPQCVIVEEDNESLILQAIDNQMFKGKRETSA